MKIIRAQRKDAATLTAIAMRAKAHWGYPDHWLLQWTKALTITRDYVHRNLTYMAVADDGTVLGFCALKLKRKGAVLDHLWILPSKIRTGIGRALFEHAERIAREAGATRLVIVGDPHAEGFYVRMGAVKCGEERAPMDGLPRVLPRFEKPLVPPESH